MVLASFNAPVRAQVSVEETSAVATSEGVVMRAAPIDTADEEWAEGKDLRPSSMCPAE